MAKIKITDLPQNMKISKDELQRVHGGAFEFYQPYQDKWLVGRITQTTTSPLVGTTLIGATVKF